MTDRELLELAAKAVEYEYSETGGGSRHDPKPGIIQPYVRWNPLTDDGDALRLAVQLNIPVYPYDDETSTGTVGVVAKNWGSAEENTRRAIVRAAAEIGRNMK